MYSVNTWGSLFLLFVLTALPANIAFWIKESKPNLRPGTCIAFGVAITLTLVSVIIIIRLINLGEQIQH